MSNLFYCLNNGQYVLFLYYSYNESSYKLSYKNQPIEYYHLIYNEEIYADMPYIFPPFQVLFDGKWPQDNSNEIIITKDLYDEYNLSLNSTITFAGTYCADECDNNNNERFEYKIVGVLNSNTFQNMIFGSYNENDNVTIQNNYYETRDFELAYSNVLKNMMHPHTIIIVFLNLKQIIRT